jgi:hypothetical protein
MNMDDGQGRKTKQRRKIKKEQEMALPVTAPGANAAASLASYAVFTV